MAPFSFDSYMAANGMLAGLVAITASSPMVKTEGAFVIGVVSGIIVFSGSKALLRMKVLHRLLSAKQCKVACSAYFVNICVKWCRGCGHLSCGDCEIKLSERRTIA